MFLSRLRCSGWLRHLCAGAWLIPLAEFAGAAEGGTPTNAVPRPAGSTSLMSAISPARWREVEQAVDRGLAWMASQQAADGSFQTLPSGQPAITSLAIMAFLSRGDQPGLGRYGERLNRAIDFVLSCQKPDGLIALMPPGPVHQDKQPSHTAIYNHAISALMLGEVYGQVSGQRGRAVKRAIKRQSSSPTASTTSREKDAMNRGGWRYIRLSERDPVDSDFR